MNYSGISECDVLNGTGFRVVLFVSGCDHKCRGCHNPETWNPNYGHRFTEDTMQYILNCLSKDYIDGITITGGDPLYKDNLNEVYKLIKNVRKIYPKKNIWLYTGYTFEDIKYVSCNDYEYEFENNLRYEIIHNVDVLVDGEYKEELRDISLKFRGSSNQRLIYVKEL